MMRYRVARDISEDALEEILNRWSILNWELIHISTPADVKGTSTYTLVFGMQVDDLMTYMADKRPGNSDDSEFPPVPGMKNGNKTSQKDGKNKKRAIRKVKGVTNKSTIKSD